METQGFLEFKDDETLLNILMNSTPTHISQGWSARKKSHILPTPQILKLQNISHAFQALYDYLGDDLVVFDIKQICGGKRQQLCHRDHHLGPRVCATLAVSDRPLKTRLYTGSHLHDNDMDCPSSIHQFHDVNSRVCVYDAYIAHCGPSSIKVETSNRFFVQCCASKHVETLRDSFGT